MLHQRSVEFGADVVNQGSARCTVVAEHANLDQFMAFQADVDFVQHGWGQAGITDHHDGMQMVSARLEFTALRGSQGNHLRSLTGRDAGAASMGMAV